MSKIRNLLVGAILGVASLSLASVAHAAPQAEPGAGHLPRDASVNGHHIDWLLKITMAFVAILFVIMCIWILISAFKHNRKHTAEYDHGDSKHSVRVALILSAIIFFVVDGNLWVDSTLDVNKIFWNFAHADNHSEVVKVEVNAHQWAWDFRYPGADGKFDTRAVASEDDVIVLNELVVPVNTPVSLQLASVDVIHSFYLPNMRVKMDAVPGGINRLWFEAKDVGDYDIACAQHCGVAHYKMKGLLRVLSKEDYARWKKDAELMAPRYYNKDDLTAHWGWEWRKAN
jgi:cytochrome c oxidase subunit II